MGDAWHVAVAKKRCALHRWWCVGRVRAVEPAAGVAAGVPDVVQQGCLIAAGPVMRSYDERTPHRLRDRIHVCVGHQGSSKHSCCLWRPRL